VKVLKRQFHIWRDFVEVEAFNIVLDSDKLKKEVVCITVVLKSNPECPLWDQCPEHEHFYFCSILWIVTLS